MKNIVEVILVSCLVAAGVTAVVALLEGWAITAIAAVACMIMLFVVLEAFFTEDNNG